MKKIFILDLAFANAVQEKKSEVMEEIDALVGKDAEVLYYCGYEKVKSNKIEAFALKYAATRELKTKEFEIDWTDFSEPCIRKTNYLDQEYNAAAFLHRNRKILQEMKDNEGGCLLIVVRDESTREPSRNYMKSEADLISAAAELQVPVENILIEGVDDVRKYKGRYEYDGNEDFLYDTYVKKHKRRFTGLEIETTEYEFGPADFEITAEVGTSDSRNTKSKDVRTYASMEFGDSGNAIIDSIRNDDGRICGIKIKLRGEREKQTLLKALMCIVDQIDRQ
ncbi:MAG: hypothetical protein K5981_09375 [Clostridia bacterium]|nr:hypothetical protein [Clostridia bacterium]